MPCCGWRAGCAPTAARCCWSRTTASSSTASSGRILHFEQGRLTAYTGNYSDFEVQHAANAERTAALVAKQRREAAHIESFVARFRAQASKARQVQSRIKWLAKLETIATVQPESDFDWDFLPPPKLPRPLVTLEKLSAGYGERRILDSISLSLHPGERFGILGRNGAGKSTLMKILADELEPLAGTRTFAPGPAHRLPGAAGAGAARRRRLGAVGVRAPRRRGDRRLGPAEAARPPRPLRLPRRPRVRADQELLRRRAARAWRCRSWWRGAPTCLLLDEPTNHLDLSMRHTLLMALQEFPGAVVIVSHDRSLLRGACDRFVLVADGALNPFDGDLEDYAAVARRRPHQPRRCRDSRAVAPRAAAPRGRGARPPHAAARGAGDSGEADRPAGQGAREPGSRAGRSCRLYPAPASPNSTSSRNASARWPRRSQGSRSAGSPSSPSSRNAPREAPGTPSRAAGARRLLARDGVLAVGQAAAAGHARGRRGMPGRGQPGELRRRHHRRGCLRSLGGEPGDLRRGAEGGARRAALHRARLRAHRRAAGARHRSGAWRRNSPTRCWRRAGRSRS